MNRMGKKRILIILFILYSFAVLWITLISRMGGDIQRIKPPFWSYKAILNGKIGTLEEDIYNIILFVPFAALLDLSTEKKTRVLFAGFVFSVFIEFSQLVFHLGTTEIDDVINNMIGVGIGFLFTGKKRYIILGLILVVSLLLIPAYMRYMRS